MAVKQARLKKTIERDIKRAMNKEEALAVLDEVAGEVAEGATSPPPEERKPGMTIGGAKVPYSYKILCDMFPIVSFVPRETILLTYNGVSVQARAGIQMHVPKCFYDIYENRQNKLDPNSLMKELRSRGITEIELGAGTL